MKFPAFQFYPGDWLKDPNLRRCSHAAKGVWIDMLCLMHEAEERGVLISGGVPWTDDDIAMAVGGDKTDCLASIAELTLKGVAKRDERGAVFNARMVRDENKRTLCQEAGKRGGNPLLTPTLKGESKGGVKGTAKGRAKGEITPSSSSSISSSSSEERLSAIYDAYPRHVGKADAMKAIDHALQRIGKRTPPPDDPTAWLLDRVRVFAASPKGQAGEYTPHPATWMNQERYDDDPKEWEGHKAAPVKQHHAYAKGGMDSELTL